eukprot:SAG22_NODE_214_length_15003_cov_18.466519_12_plen_84_part_00
MWTSSDTPAALPFLALRLLAQRLDGGAPALTPADILLPLVLKVGDSWRNDACLDGTFTRRSPIHACIKLPLSPLSVCGSLPDN